MDSDRILEHLDDPEALEALYRESPGDFRRALSGARKRRPGEIVLRVWAARLSGGRRAAADVRSLIPALAIALGCGLLVRLPAVWLGAEWYYPRFAPSCVLLALALYFWLERRDRGRLAAGLILIAATVTLGAVLPGQTDSVVMALAHLPVIWWVFLGYVFTGPSWRRTEARIRFLRYNGELLVLGSLVALGGMVFSAITVGLFHLVFEGAEDWYAGNIGIVGAAAVPVVATFLYDTVFRRHTGIASVLARVFAPLFLVMTVSYLAAAILGGRSPFLDREFLITMNGLLVVVLGMTVLSVAGRGEEGEAGTVDHVNTALLAVILIVDILALSAIVFRLTSYGLTPNRVVVLGMNVVVLAHLALAFRAYVRFVRGRTGIEGVRKPLCGYLPVYAAWAAVVSFVLPFVFGFS